MPAAVRPPRPAATRRALLTVLFLGGFLALAFLFGGSAQAASGADQDGREVPGSAAGLLESGESSGSASGADSGTGSRPGSGEDSSGTSGGTADDTADNDERGLTKAELAERQRREAQQASGLTASDVMGPVAESGNRAQEITRPVGEAVQGVTHPAGLGELPGWLGLGKLDGDDAGDGSGHGSGQGADGDAGGMPGATEGTGGHHADWPRTQGSWGITSGDWLTGTPGHAAAGDGIPSGDGAPTDGLPFHHTPATPVPSTSQYKGDSQQQRGGPHQFAAFITGTEHFGPLQPGALRAADGTPTRDSAGDVLEFPG